MELRCATANVSDEFELKKINTNGALHYENNNSVCLLPGICLISIQIFRETIVRL